MDKPNGTILTRLSDVVYWACTGVAVLIAANDLYNILSGKRVPISFEDAIILFAIAAAVWAIGRATKYILAGK